MTHWTKSLISIFGWLGFQHFYLGKIGKGIIWILTGGILGIGSLVDLFTLGGAVDNGNISAIEWANSDNSGYFYTYKFDYDQLNRLTNGNTGGNNFAEKFNYDKHGNIEILKRYSENTLIDDLTMTYNGNRLTNITDNAGSRNEYYTKEYHPKGDGVFEYDKNGNLIKDNDRKIEELEDLKYKFEAQAESEVGIDFYSWDFSHNEQEFKADIVMDKEGKQTRKFQEGEHNIAVQAVDKKGLTGTDKVKIAVIFYA